jgi:hypothetical protein
MSEQPTPETDAEVTTFTSISKLKRRFEASTGKVSADFARRLERERDEARELAQQMSDSNQVLLADVRFYRNAWEQLKEAGQ